MYVSNNIQLAMKITLALAEPTLELLRHCQGSECYDTAYYRK